jgi:hypothetical protein
MDQACATLDTLLDDRFENILLHVGLRTADRRSGAKHAVGLAVIRRFNPNSFRKRLTQKCHGIGDYIRGDRADGANKRLPKSGHVESFDISAIKDRLSGEFLRRKSISRPKPS